MQTFKVLRVKLLRLQITVLQFTKTIFSFVQFFLCPVMMSSTSHLFLYLWARPGWQAELWTEAGSVAFGCSDWRAWGRGCRRWARQRTPSSLTTWLDGWRPGGGRVELSISRSASQWQHVWTVSSGPPPLLRRRSDQLHLRGVCAWANPVFLPVLRPDWRRRARNCT